MRLLCRPRPLRRVLATAVVAAVVAAFTLFGAGGATATAAAQGLTATSCGYAIIASVPVLDANYNKIAQLRLWNYTCTNQVHAEILSATSGCFYVQYFQAVAGSNYVANNNHTICGNGSYVNTGVLPYVRGGSYAWTYTDKSGYVQTQVV